jgi:hypothetical protein
MVRLKPSAIVISVRKTDDICRTMPWASIVRKFRFPLFAGGTISTSARPKRRTISCSSSAYGPTFDATTIVTRPDSRACLTSRVTLTRDNPRLLAVS